MINKIISTLFLFVVTSIVFTGGLMVIEKSLSDHTNISEIKNIYSRISKYSRINAEAKNSKKTTEVLTAQTSVPEENQNQVCQNKLNKIDPKSGSIVSVLHSLGLGSSYAERIKIAQHFGLTDYRGTASQNVRLIEIIKNNKDCQYK